MSENKTVRNFKRPKILRYSKNHTGKPKQTRCDKGLEMAGIVKAVTKELEPEDPFKNLVLNY